MRTTVTLDPDVADRLNRLAHERRRSFKETLNDVLRRGLARQESPSEPRRFTLKPHRSGFRPGVDAGKLNQLLDDLEVRGSGGRGGRR